LAPYIPLTTSLTNSIKSFAKLQTLSIHADLCHSFK